MKKDNEHEKYMEEDDRAFVKESRFSYIKPNDGIIG